MPRRVPRKPRPKKTNVPKGYDSLWEYDIHQTILQDWKHHWNKVEYVIHHKYEPDFVKKIGGKTILLEAKGRFWDHAEYSKYIHIREALNKSYTELVFLFQKPFAPMPGAKMRKNGTKRTHAEWAEKIILHGTVKILYLTTGETMNYKFNEGQLIQELQAYIDGTYGEHYASDKYQATDVIIDSGHGMGFCMGNIIKYAKRYGNKDGHNRKDLLKILHYGIIMLDIHDDRDKFLKQERVSGRR